MKIPLHFQINTGLLQTLIANHSPRKLSAHSKYQKSEMSIFSRIPYSPLFHRSNTQISNTIKASSLLSSPPHNLFFFNPITIQPIPTKIPKSSSPSPSISLQPVEELPPKLQEIVNLFRGVPEPKDKYAQLLFYERNLNPLESQYKTSDNKVQGCVSQVWVRAYLDSDKNVIFEADSDSELTKGLAALLVQGLSGRPVDEIVRVSPDFVVLLGLQQSLTPSRNNGFLNMLRLMQKKALQLYFEAENAGNEAEKAGNSSGEEFGKGPVENSNLESSDGARDDGSESSETFVMDYAEGKELYL
ncbi:sufE-like protein 1, chloroplastic/mitochondrial [Henckelia pumila]|uniref:sufE-like protein 1, chloroplastic/mitochondrial n=1 Tax=Henckelia pumila TaxID=405737 RepID=UPI003C6E0535